jgi:hypothetical protein
MAVADPMIELAGHWLASNCGVGHRFPSAAASAATPGGRITWARSSPASVSVCVITVVSGGFVDGSVWPGDPIVALSLGSKASLSHPVVVNDACPVAVSSA